MIDTYICSWILGEISQQRNCMWCFKLLSLNVLVTIIMETLRVVALEVGEEKAFSQSL